MWWFLGMQSLPVGFCLAYLLHSVRRRLYAQAAAVGVLTTIHLAAIATLLYEFLALP